MNRRVLVFLWLVSAFFSSCSDSKKSSIEEDLLELNTQTLDFNAKENYAFIGITSNTQWAATCDAAWLTPVPASGENHASLRVTAEANTLSSVRTCTVTVATKGGIAKTVKVTQTGTDPYILIDPVSAEALPAGEEITVNVTASAQWTVQVPDEAMEWISVKAQTGTQVVVSVTSNQSGAVRTACISFGLEGTDSQASFSLSQQHILPDLTIDPAQMSVADEASDITVNVTCDVAWDVRIPAADTWVTVKQKTDNQVVFSVEINSGSAMRTAEIDFLIEGFVANTFTLNQSTATVGGGYELMGKLGDIPNSIIGQTNSWLHTNLFRDIGFDYSEYPNCTGNGGYPNGKHLEILMDATLNKPVMRFYIHINTAPNTPYPINGGYLATTDRCGTSDRQRNEFKSATNNTTWSKMQGHYNEWQILRWKMRIPKGYQPTNNFCHIHQIKAQDGSNNGSPMITITLRANSNSGTNRRVCIEHTASGSGTSRGNMKEAPIDDFENEWVQIEEEMHFMPQGGNTDQHGFYRIKITRIRDNKVLIEHQRGDIEMIRKTATFLRGKWGIYRSLGGDIATNQNNKNSLLKDEYIDMCDFEVWRKNHNPNPAQPM
ncbi:MAG: hypothetical protein LBQ60_12120 [Bacteroidales bacterium]|jgi:hypothetical protein|nr:hypothetical protein [Bacteroidales bacterium]